MATSHDLHVIFGTGTAGAATMRALVNMGKQVRMVNRSGKPSLATGDALPAGVEIVSGDANDPASTTRLTQGAAAVYQCSQPEYHEWAQKFPALQAGILAGAAANGARLVLLENLYLYGDVNGAPIHEGLPVKSNTKKGALRAALYETAMAAHRAGQVRVTAARPSDYYGKGYMVTADQLFYPVLAGKAASGIGNPDLPHSFSYTEDVGRALAILGTDDRADGRAWHVPSAPAITQRAFFEMAYRLAGTSGKVGGINKLMMRMAGLFIPNAREMIEMMYEFEKPFILDSSAFTRTFGMNATPIEQGLTETLAWFRAHPKETVGAH